MGISAIVSDLHSNLPALRAVVKYVKAHSCDEILCLGDIAGYGAQPSEVIALLQEMDAKCIQGNHDSLITGQNPGRNYSSVSHLAAAHNREIMSEQELNFLAELPMTLNGPQNSLLIHGSPEYQDTYLINEAQMSAAASEVHGRMGPGLCFFGHTHVPAFHDGKNWEFVPGQIYHCDPEARIMINPGSVGQPRDGDSRASFVMWDRDENTIRLMKADYDVEAARDAILAAGLPKILGDRLLRGH